MAEPFELSVEKGKVREFARAVGSSDPAHFEGEHPVSPPTFLMTALHWQGPDSQAWPRDRDQSRVLHGSQEFDFPDGPPRAGTRLTGRNTIEKEWTKSGSRGGEMRFTLLLTEYHDDDGKLVAQVRNTLIETSKPTGASK